MNPLRPDSALHNLITCSCVTNRPVDSNGSTKQLDKSIFEAQEEIRALEDIYELVLLDYNYLTSPKKLMEYSQKYFEEELEKKKITDLEK